MSRWLDRPGLVAIAAFVVGGAIAGVVAVLIVVLRDGDGEGDRQAVATATPLTTDDAGPDRTPDGITPTPGSATDPDAALAAFVENELDAAYIGDCEQYTDPAAAPEGICSIELYRSEELVTFYVGPPFSEIIGEAVITPSAQGSWSVAFVGSGPLGETVAVDSDAVVFGAGSCLRFRQEPGTSAGVVTCQLDGTRARVVEGPVEADGHTWWRLEGLGWASEEFLRPVGE